MAINDLLSKELKVPALKPGEKKVFRKLLKGKIDSATGEPYILADYWQQGKAIIYDPSAKKRVLLLNEIGVRPRKLESGATIMEPDVGMVHWDETGEKLLTDERFEEYCFLMRSNQNDSNKFRNKRIKATFYLVDKVNDTKLQLADFDLTMEAAYYCRSAEMSDLREIAKKLNIKVEPTLLRTEVLNRIQNGGAKEIMIASTNNHVKKRIQITDAEKYGIILFNDLQGQWFFEDKLTESFCEVSLDKDRIEGLIDFFGTKEGSGVYSLLAKKVRKLYEAV